MYQSVSKISFCYQKLKTRQDNGNKKTNSDSDLVNVLKNDGVGHSELVKYENCSTVNLRDLREDLGMGSWR